MNRIKIDPKLTKTIYVAETYYILNSGEKRWFPITGMSSPQKKEVWSFIDKDVEEYNNSEFVKNYPKQKISRKNYRIRIYKRVCNNC